MYKHSDSGLILDDDILSESHIPHIISARSVHVSELGACLAPVFAGRKPRSVWLYGSPGTGKTTVASYVLRKLNKEKGIPGVYVNCWKYNSFYAVLEFILGQLRRSFGDARDKRVKLEQFERLVKDRPFIIVLDEIDVVPCKERDTMIYNLSNVGQVGLMLISESRYPILALESRVRSRLNPCTLEFQPYTVDQLVEILTQRAAGALHPKAWDKRTLELVAEIAGGDARVAIQTHDRTEACEPVGQPGKSRISVHDAVLSEGRLVGFHHCHIRIPTPERISPSPVHNRTRRQHGNPVWACRSKRRCSFFHLLLPVSDSVSRSHVLFFELRVRRGGVPEVRVCQGRGRKGQRTSWEASLVLFSH